MITVENQPDDQWDGAPIIKVTFLGKLQAPLAGMSCRHCHLSTRDLGTIINYKVTFPAVLSCQTAVVIVRSSISLVP